MDQSERGAGEDLPASIFWPNGFSFFAIYKEELFFFISELLKTCFFTFPWGFSTLGVLGPIQLKKRNNF